MKLSKITMRSRKAADINPTGKLLYHCKVIANEIIFIWELPGITTRCPSPVRPSPAPLPNLISTPFVTNCSNLVALCKNFRASTFASCPTQPSSEQLFTVHYASLYIFGFLRFRDLDNSKAMSDLGSVSSHINTFPTLHSYRRIICTFDTSTNLIHQTCQHQCH